jgi:hypothetical protein
VAELVACYRSAAESAEVFRPSGINTCHVFTSNGYYDGPDARPRPFDRDGWVYDEKIDA